MTEDDVDTYPEDGIYFLGISITDGTWNGSQIVPTKGATSVSIPVLHLQAHPLSSDVPRQPLLDVFHTTDSEQGFIHSSVTLLRP